MDEVSTEDDDAREARARLAARAATVFTRRQPTMTYPPPPSEVTRVVDAGLAAAGTRSRERVELLAAKSYLIALAPDWDAADDADGEAAARQALALAEAMDDADLISSAIDTIDLRRQALDLFGEVYENSRRRLELVPRLTAPSEISDAYVTAAWSSVIIGRYREAIANATQCIAVAAGVDEGQYVHGLVWRVAAAFACGEWDQALADHDEIERHVRESSGGVPPTFAAHAYATVMFCHHLRGDAQRSRTYVGVVNELEQRGESNRGVNGSRAWTARMLAHAGRTQEAEAALGRMQGRDLMYSEEALADVLAARAAWSEATRAGARLRAAARHSGRLMLPWFADRLDGQVALARGDLDTATTALRRAVNGFDGLGTPWEAARTRVFLAESTRDATELERALAQFEQLGAAVDAEDCRRRLARVRS